MSRIVEVYIDDETERRLEAASKDLDATVKWLAEASVSEAALNWANQNPTKAEE